MRDYFEDRRQAGQDLAESLMRYRGQADLLVLGLPRGGVPVAAEVARGLRAELDVLVVRKVAQPFHPEVALAAIASGGARALNAGLIEDSGITPAEFNALVAAEQRELERRERAYRGDRPPPRVAGRTVILVDDGIATGASMKAAVAALRTLKPAKVVVAVPVAPPAARVELGLEVDDYACLIEPRELNAVGWWYRAFPQLRDSDVQELLAAADTP